MRVSTILQALAATLAAATPARALPADIAVTEPRLTSDKYDWECETTSLHPDHNNVVEAECPRSNGDGTYTLESSSLDLNKCLGNEKGRLVWRPNGNFMDTCKDCTLSNSSKKFPVLTCDCEGWGQYPRAVLAWGLINDNGTLDCHPNPNPRLTPNLPNWAWPRPTATPAPSS